MVNSKHAIDFGVKDLWYGLTDEEQVAACECFWEKEDHSDSQTLTLILNALAKRLNFRPKFLKRKSIPERAKYLARHVPHPNIRGHALAIIRVWLLQTHNEMICCFLDAINVPHANGLIDCQPEPASQSSFKDAIHLLLSKYDSRIVSLYIAYLLVGEGGPLWSNLPEAVESVPLDISSMLSAARNEQEDGDANNKEDDSLPEVSESFTTLDKVLIKAMVACALDTDYALPEEEVEHLVEEVVELNVDRQHSYFHRGFFNALFDREMAFDFPGANEERRSWYLCGAFLGYLRRSNDSKCRELLNKQRALVVKLVDNKKLRCGAMMLPLVYDLLRKVGEYGLLNDWLRNQIYGVPRGQREALLVKVYEDAASLLRRGSSSEAGLLLEVMAQILINAQFLDKAFIDRYRPLICRKRGQALQLEGNFSEARTRLESCVDSLESEDAANTLADLGLIAGGFRSLVSVLPRKDETAVPGMYESLALGETAYRRAIEEHGKSATNAYFCMGIMHFIAPTRLEEECATYLQFALDGMLRKQDAYSEGDLIDWIWLLLGIALLETADPARLQIAEDRIRHSLQSQDRFPIWLWKRALEALRIFDRPDIVEEVAVNLLKGRGDDAFAILQSPDLCTMEVLQEPFLSWLKEKPVPAIQKWDDMELLFVPLFNNSTLELCGDLLDYMETQAALERQCRHRFIHFLREHPSLQPVWDEDDIAASLARCYELEGDFINAAVTLRSVFYRLRDSGGVHEVQEARQLIERIQAYGIGEDHWRDLDNSLVSLESPDLSPEEARGRLEGKHKVHVLYIGGNETQQAYADAIEEELQQQYPGISCTLMFPGWNSNWRQDFETARRHIPASDVVVLNRLIRTELGRAIRKQCGSEHPWIGCGGRGKDSIQRRIIDAAVWITSIKQSPESPSPL